MMSAQEFSLFLIENETATCYNEESFVFLHICI